MQGIHIVGVGKALPARVVTNDDMSKIVDTNDEWIRTRTGIRQRYICEEEMCHELATKAAMAAVEKAGISLEEIGAVVVATTTSDYAFPSMACMVQKALNLPKEVIAFDISAACSGFLYGLRVCQGLLLTGSKKYALLIGSEKMSRVTDFTDRSTCVLFGDGAGAAVLELSDNLFVHAAWADGDNEALMCPGAGCENAHIKMSGNQVFKFAVKVIREGIDTVLEKANLSMDDIDYVVCHQANERIIENVKGKYKGSEDKFYVNIGTYANTSAASIPIALEEMYASGKLKPGMKIISVGFGAGFTWSSALLTI